MEQEEEEREKKLLLLLNGNTGFLWKRVVDVIGYAITQEPPPPFAPTHPFPTSWLPLVMSRLRGRNCKEKK